MRLALVLTAAFSLTACSGEPGQSADAPPPLTTVGLVVDHDPGTGWRPLDRTSRDAMPLGPTTLTLHDGRTLSVPEVVTVDGWCWELGGRPQLAAARQCYLGFALAEDGRTVRAAAVLHGSRGRGDALVSLRDQDRFLAETLNIEGIWRNVSASTAYLRDPGGLALTVAEDVRISCVGEDTPQELRDGALVSLTVDRGTAQLSTVSCLYTD